MLLNIVSNKAKEKRPPSSQKPQRPLKKSLAGGRKQAKAVQNYATHKHDALPAAQHRIKDSEIAATSFVPDDDDDGVGSINTKEAESKILRTHNAKKFDRSMFAESALSFASLNLSQRIRAQALIDGIRLVDILEADLGYNRPTKIQAQAIPTILTGKDVMFKSKTGSGKTLAFLLPTVQRLQDRKRRLKRSDGTRCITIAPTRELAVQINHVIGIITKPFHWLVSTTVMGGERKKSEKARLRKGAIIVVATPGRLLDHMMTTRAFDVRRVETLVLDEADRLLDLGFEKDLKNIINILDECQSLPNNQRRQTILTSATLSTGVLGLAEVSLKEPVKIGVEGEAEDNNIASARLHQHYIKADSKYRVTVLAAFLRSVFQRRQGKSGARKAIVFLSTCDSVEFHYRLFRYCSWPPDGTKQPRNPWLPKSVISYKLHGNIPQKDRTKTFFRFCNAEEGLLFCTDVAARGLDLPSVDYIIQFDPPDDTTTYIHRIGRTARMGQRGQAVLFLQKLEVEYVKLLEAKGMNLTEINVVKVLAELNPEPEDNLNNCVNKEFEDDTLSKLPPGLQLQHQFEALVASDIELHELARLSFLSSIRAYGAYPRAMKSIFHPRKLHLGWVAKSFGLREPPKRLARDKLPSRKQDQQKKRGKDHDKAKEETGRDSQAKNRKGLIVNPIDRKKFDRNYGDDLRKSQKRKHFSASHERRGKRRYDVHRSNKVKNAAGNLRFGKVNTISEFAS